MSDGWKYQTAEAAVMPFSPGTDVYVDGMLSRIYYQLRDQNRLENTFCGDIPNHDKFIESFSLSKRATQILCEQDGTLIKPVGLSWVELPKGEDGQRAAMCGFAFVKRSRQMLNLGRLGIYYWMDGMKINTVHGVMLESNLMALEYARKLGFYIGPTIPKFHFVRGKMQGAIVVHIEDNDFLPPFEPWFEKNRVVSQ